jgi:hypothetical protein
MHHPSSRVHSIGMRGVLLEPGGPGDRAEAMDLAAGATKIAQELQMVRVVGMLEALATEHASSV